MMIRFFGLAVCLWPLSIGVAVADPLPAAYQVRDVTQADVLNIRATPSAVADVVGEIGPFAHAIEVIETSADGKWGKVSTRAGNGWVNMRYLEATVRPDPGLVPRPLSCFGTEPFWNIGLFARGAEYNSPETGAVPMTVVSEAVAPQGYLVLLEEGPKLNRTLVITREACSDGMSDRAFGFSARMFLEALDGNAVHGACCTLDHR
jgi:uncharacterized membrane protein